MVYTLGWATAAAAEEDSATYKARHDGSGTENTSYGYGCDLPRFGWSHRIPATRGRVGMHLTGSSQHMPVRASEGDGRNFDANEPVGPVNNRLH